ncbi:MAG TPA: flagellar hook capping FlgD N-terminal domain-containing protein [Candidatus Hydrogenedentes bacterium]|nr:flagellar hook capping FlgD N-terminal domain-containing protein [Candidatus Hydrogenedentota bacterium]HQH50864.1 flagellar hook capping FlgD N-terminal domain-containing protein [Candidatus Hydrogenedentota bacterium]HQM48688.1 flagellar hook capping FlgD N-terminal domain-containing protein [Candidatus Hydrogenedentota bacterium]
MNALVAIRDNFAGDLSSTRIAREEVAGKLQSMSDARVAYVLKQAGLVKKSDSAEVAYEMTNDLDRDAFLQLLVLEMQHQDPLNPVDNTEMVAQLAQFASLEQMNNLNESFETLSGNFDQLNFISASSLVGHEVTGIDDEGNLVQGTVETVHLDGSLVYLTVDGKLLSMAGVLSVG